MKGRNTESVSNKSSVDLKVANESAGPLGQQSTSRQDLDTENKVKNVLIIFRGYCGSVPEPSL